MPTKVNGTVESITYSDGGAIVRVRFDDPPPNGETVSYDVTGLKLRGFERADDHEPPFKVDVTGDPPTPTDVKVHR